MTISCVGFIHDTRTPAYHVFNENSNYVRYSDARGWQRRSAFLAKRLRLPAERLPA